MRISSAIFVVAVTLCLSVVGCDGKPDSKAELVVVSSETSVNRVLYELESANVPATRVTESVSRKPVYKVMVAPADLKRAREVLVKRNLPREEHGGFATMLSDAGMIPTATDERARLMSAIADELNKTLETMSDIVVARVHVYLPDTNALTGIEPEAPSVAVLLKYKSQPLDATRIDEVKALVAGALPKVDAKSIRLVQDRAEAMSAENTPPGTGGSQESDNKLAAADRNVKLLFSAMVVLAVGVLVLTVLLYKARQQPVRVRAR